jgi:hypothetical protein
MHRGVLGFSLLSYGPLLKSLGTDLVVHFLNVCIGLILSGNKVMAGMQDRVQSWVSHLEIASQSQ